MSSAGRVIILKTSDNQLFEVEEAVAGMLATVKRFFEEPEKEGSFSSGSVVMPLPNVHSRELVPMIAYCKGILELEEGDEEGKKRCDKALMRGLRNAELKELIIAANYLEAKPILGALVQGVADLIKDKNVEYVRKFFGIKNDYTPEEEAKMREDNLWAFEDVDDEEEYVE